MLACSQLCAQLLGDAGGPDALPPPCSMSRHSQCQTQSLMLQDPPPAPSRNRSTAKTPAAPPAPAHQPAVCSGPRADRHFSTEKHPNTTATRRFPSRGLGSLTREHAMGTSPLLNFRVLRIEQPLPLPAVLVCRPCQGLGELLRGPATCHTAPTGRASPWQRHPYHDPACAHATRTVQKDGPGTKSREKRTIHLQMGFF